MARWNTIDGSHLDLHSCGRVSRRPWFPVAFRSAKSWLVAVALLHAFGFFVFLSQCSEQESNKVNTANGKSQEMKLFAKRQLQYAATTLDVGVKSGSFSYDELHPQGEKRRRRRRKRRRRLRFPTPTSPFGLLDKPL